MKRIRTRIGDVFCARLDNHTKRYFQYVANDATQLSSNVVRVFKRFYESDATPELDDIVADQEDFYVHITVSLGIEMGLWEKLGIVGNLGSLDVLFRDTEDYGRKVGEEPIMVSTNWYVWRLNEKFRHVGKLKGKHKSAFVGLIINPCGFMEMLEGKKYPPLYPE